jgi:hypothetical protein
VKVLEDLTGKKFGSWIVLGFSHRKEYNYYWNCKCVCGNIKKVPRNRLISGKSTQCRSCQCVKKSTTHGKSKHPLYKVWEDIKSRCNNPNKKAYKMYGKRDIKLCKDWENNFYNWSMKNNWKSGLDFHRIDNDKGYSPENCILLTRQKHSKTHAILNNNLIGNNLWRNYATTNN